MPAFARALSSCSGRYILAGYVWAAAGLTASMPLHGHDLDDAVIEAMRVWKTPGLSVAVVVDGELAFVRGYGVREVRSTRPVTENTIFGIGSISKSFITTAAAALVNDGALAWNDKSREVLSWLTFRDSWITEHNTLADLGSHRTGVASDFAWIHRDRSMRETVRLLSEIEPAAPYGRYAYSNVAITALAAAVEERAGVSWATVVQDRLLTPLGMHRTGFSEEDYVEPGDLARCWLCRSPPGARYGLEALASPDESVAVPHGLETHGGEHYLAAGGEPVVWPWRYSGATAPAGSINSTAADMARWMLLHLGAGGLPQRAGIGVEAIRELHKPQVIMPAPVATGDSTIDRYHAAFSHRSYALGWMEGVYRGYDAVTHSGGQVGFGARVWLIPAEGLGVVVLQNMDYRLGEAYQSVSRLFLDYYLGLPAVDWDKSLIAIRAREIDAGSLFYRPLSELVDGRAQPRDLAPGRYVNAVMGDAVVETDGKGLVLRFPSGSEARLHSRTARDDAALAVFTGADAWRAPLLLERDSVSGPARAFRFGGEGSTTSTYDFRSTE